MNALTTIALAVSGKVLGVDLLQHYNYDVLDRECPCRACCEWREKQAKFFELQKTTIDHPLDCRCADCKERRRGRTIYAAANDRRSVLCEVSFHASMQRPEVGQSLMSWLWNEIIVIRKRPDSWWERRGAERPINGWLSEFNSARLAASGAVF